MTTHCDRTWFGHGESVKTAAALRSWLSPNAKSHREVFLLEWKGKARKYSAELANAIAQTLQTRKRSEWACAPLPRHIRCRIASCWSAYRTSLDFARPPKRHSSSTRNSGARGGSRTHMRKNPRRILSPQRLPFRHPGSGRYKSSGRDQLLQHLCVYFRPHAEFDQFSSHTASARFRWPGST
jgi:hypothetical protein